MIILRKYLLLSLFFATAFMNAGQGDEEEYIIKQNSAPAEEFYWTNGATGLIGGVLVGSGCAAFGANPTIAQVVFASCVAGLGANAVVYTMRHKENPGRKNASQIKSVGSAMLGTHVGLGATLLLLSVFKK